MAHDYFGERIAERYDCAEAEMFDPGVVEPTVALLAELAGDRPILELGIGTGRVALPLSERGIRVHGIDLSPSMLAQLRAKPGAERIELTQGDFSHVQVGRTFGVAFVVFNTIMNLTSQDQQVSCFRNVAGHLGTDGYFVVEVMMPDLRRLPPGESGRVVAISPRLLRVDEYDVAAQRLVSHCHRIDERGECESTSIPFRYVWPAELDLMAQLAGMTLRHRWGGWNREPFTGSSRQHVSVWQKTATTATTSPPAPSCPQDF